MRLLCLDLLLISVIFSDFNRQQKGKISDKDKNRSGRRWGYNLFLFSAALDLAPPPTWRLQGQSVRDSSLPLPALGWARTKAWKQGVLRRAAGVQDLQGGGDTDRSECECSALSAHTGAGKESSEVQRWTENKAWGPGSAHLGFGGKLAIWKVPFFLVFVFK